MAFIVTNVNTKSNINMPSFSDWLDTLDSNVISRYPEFAGNTPAQAVSYFVTDEIEVSADGFISEENSSNDDQSVWTNVQTWEDQASYLASLDKNFTGNGRMTGNIITSTDSSIVQGISTIFEYELDPGDNISVRNRSTNQMQIVGTVSSIQSNISLTLEANATLDVNDSIFASNKQQPSVLAYLNNMYQGLYPTTTVTTFANV